MQDHFARNAKSLWVFSGYGLKQSPQRNATICILMLLRSFPFVPEPAQCLSWYPSAGPFHGPSLVICHGPDAARPLRRLRPDRGAPQAGETTGRNSRPAGRAELAPRRTSLVAAPAGTFHVMVCGKYSEKILPSWVQGSVNPSYVCCFINPLIVAISWYKPTSLTVGHHIVSNIPSFINTKITHSSSFP